MKSLRKSSNKEDEYLWLSTINPSTPPWCLNHETFAESTKKNEGEAYPISCIGTAIFAPWEIIELTVNVLKLLAFLFVC